MYTLDKEINKRICMYTLDKEINALCKQRNELLTLNKLAYDHPVLQYKNYDIDDIDERNKLIAYYQRVYDEEQQKFDEKLKRDPNYRFTYVSKWN